MSIEDDSDARWKVGIGGIKLDDLVLISLHHVSRGEYCTRVLGLRISDYDSGSWQPHLRLRRPSAILHGNLH
jgi:hypothetical protein